MLSRDATAGIAHSHDDPVRTLTRSDSDAPAARCVRDGVRDEIAGLRGGCAIECLDGFKLPGYVDLLALERMSARIRTREEQERLDQSRDPGTLLEAGCERLAVGFAGAPSPMQPRSRLSGY